MFRVKKRNVKKRNCRMLIFAVSFAVLFAVLQQFRHKVLVQTVSLQKNHHQAATTTAKDTSEKEQEQEESIKELMKNKKQIQPSHGTQMNRYPEQYSFLKELVAQNQSEADKKILSFGCATGMEPLTLAQQYFEEPSIKIFGVDVADYALSESTKRASEVPEGKITILDGREVSPKVHGPFDAVLGNSVFCIYGKRDVPYQNITYVMEMFPFSVFESMLDEIDLYLKVGGVLTVFNSNYDFMDTHLADRYEPISDKKCPNHFVPRIDQENKKFVDVKDEMMDCLFRKVKRTSAAPALIATAKGKSE